MKTNKLLVFGASLALSLFCLVVLKAPSAFAATKTWDSGGGDDNFNTAANWSGDSVPTNGDDLVFNLALLSADETLTNNISSLTANSITFTGSNASFYRYTLTGNAITVTSAITDSEGNIIDLDITLGGDVTATMQHAQSGTTFGSSGNTRTLDTNAHTLTVTGTGVSCGMSMYSKLGGVGGVVVNLPAGGVKFKTDATSYTGPIALTAGMISVDSPGAFGSTAGVTVTGASRLGLALDGANRTYTFPITLSGTGLYGSSLIASKAFSTIGCSGGGPDASVYTATLTGGLTLNSDVIYSGSYVNTNVTGTFNSNGHDLTVKSGSVGTITTSAGTVAAPVETIVVNAGDDQPGTSVSVGNSQTYIINGVRGSVSVDFGGVLKGSGVVGGLYVQGGGRLAPGQSPGCLTTNGNVSFEANSHFDVELGGTTPCSGYDQLVANGTVSFYDTGPNLNIWLYNGFTPAAGQTYTIINNDGSDAISQGTFRGLPQGATFNSDGYIYQISYTGGDGNDVVLTVVSVPAAPDTGLAYFQNRPLTTLFATSLIAGAVVVLARTYNKRMNAKI